jgi:DNA-binding LacI/PurR family transcriptional regulator
MPGGGVPINKRATIADIARLAGVSPGAVSYALNGRPGVSDETRARIVAVADEIGWRPNVAARSLTVSRAQAVGWVIARQTPTLGVEPFFMQLIAGLERELSAAGVALLLQVAADHDHAIAAIRSWWAERRIDGVILTDLWTDDPRVAVVAELGIPAVLVGRPQPGSVLPAVWSDERHGVDAVMDYLVALGHRRIAWVAGLATLDHTHVRVQAYLAAVERHGLDAPTVVSTDYTRVQGERATRRLMTAADRPTAIVYDNDVMAVAALSVARELGLSVPDDLSIVAAEDSELCVLVNPAVTALSRDIAAYGSMAARTLLDRLDAEGPIPSRQDHASELVPRGSTAPPAHARRPAGTRAERS